MVSSHVDLNFLIYYLSSLDQMSSKNTSGVKSLEFHNTWKDILDGAVVVRFTL